MADLVKQPMPSATPRAVLARSGARGPFRLHGTDLEVGSDSVSSEWTTDSEAEAPKPGEKRRQTRNFRIAHRLDSGSESSSSSGTSSSTSSGSSSTTDGVVAQQKRQRVEMQQEWARQKAAGLKPWVVAAAAAGVTLCNGQASPVPHAADVAMAPSSPQPAAAVSEVALPQVPESSDLQWFSTTKRYRCFAVAPGFLSLDDIKAIHAAAKHPSVKEINDRKGYLAFKHRVWRFDPQLRALCPKLYHRLISLMGCADAAKWRRMRRNSKHNAVYPEVEYISYDVAEQGEPCYIEPHVDNKSAVTMVAMLSEPSSYLGGRSCFRRAKGRDGCRELVLNQGDIVLFRGEKLSHWISPVTAGHRIILQIELSRV